MRKMILEQPLPDVRAVGLLKAAETLVYTEPAQAEAMLKESLMLFGEHLMAVNAYHQLVLLYGRQTRRQEAKLIAAHGLQWAERHGIVSDEARQMRSRLAGALKLEIDDNATAMRSIQLLYESACQRAEKEGKPEHAAMLLADLAVAIGEHVGQMAEQDAIKVFERAIPQLDQHQEELPAKEIADPLLRLAIFKSIDGQDISSYLNQARALLEDNAEMKSRLRSRFVDVCGKVLGIRDHRLDDISIPGQQQTHLMRYSKHPHPNIKALGLLTMAEMLGKSDVAQAESMLKECLTLCGDHPMAVDAYHQLAYMYSDRDDNAGRAQVLAEGLLWAERLGGLICDEARRLRRDMVWSVRFNHRDDDTRAKELETLFYPVIQCAKQANKPEEVAVLQADLAASLDMHCILKKNRVVELYGQAAPLLLKHKDKLSIVTVAEPLLRLEMLDKFRTRRQDGSPDYVYLVMTLLEGGDAEMVRNLQSGILKVCCETLNISHPYIS